MKQNINVNEFVFGRTRAQKKLEVLDSLNERDLLNVSDSTIMRIYKECRGKDSDGKPNDRFLINYKRKVGNNWNSTIDFIYEYRNKPCVCLYIQNSSTDSSITMGFDEFKRGGTFYGSIRGSYTYRSDDVARVIRCILKEFVFWKYIEKEERERKEKIAKVLHWKIYNPVCNHFYDEWRCKYEGCGFMEKTPRTDRYHRAEKRVKEYVEQNIDELIGKSAEELQDIYRKIFRETD